MPKRLYARLIVSNAKTADQRTRETIFYGLLLSVILVGIIALLNNAALLIIYHHGYMVYRLAMVAVVVAALVGLYLWVRRYNQYTNGARLFVLLFIAIPLAATFQWGHEIPIGLLLSAFAIIMAGILINARWSLYATGIIASGLLLLKISEDHNLHHPNTAWTRHNGTVGDIVGFTGVMLVIALISYFFNRQMERSLQRARRSEQKLNRQNARLEQIVAERTQQLQAEQLEKLQEFYRFAELGRISSALFHDLANHLTTMSLHIDGLQNPEAQPVISGLQRDMNYIDDVVQRVRQQLRGHTKPEQFDAIQATNEVVQILRQKALMHHISIELQHQQPVIRLRSDLTKFRQVVINLLNNAIDATIQSSKRQKQIVIKLAVSADNLEVCVIDHGVGIPKAKQDTVFEPFFTTKKNGTGIGLFIVKEIVTHDLHGKITVLSKRSAGTTFCVEIPKRLA